MNAQTLVPMGGSAPPLNLDGATPAELRDLCKGLYGDLTFLSGIVPEKLGPTVSTGVTFLFAGLAGAFDGGVGEKNNKIGPVGITTALAVGAAAAAIFAPSANYREGAAAVARGVGAPLLYLWAKGGTEEYAMKRKLNAAAVAANTNTNNTKIAAA